MKKIFTLSFLLYLIVPARVVAQSIGTFSNIAPAPQSTGLVIPATHTFQRIIKSGDALSTGGILGGATDFTGYVPISGSSANGYLSISSETAPAECAILSITFDELSRLWKVNSGGKVPLPFLDIGASAAFCSGTVTPKNTIMVCEEVTTTIDANGDGYRDLGWVIEIDPATRTVINQDGMGGVDKLWALGNQNHENVTIKGDQTVLYYGADDAAHGFIYKYVPTVAGNYASGNLYVLQTSGSGTGTWVKIANSTPAERNNVINASIAAGAHNFDRVEDVEIGPDGKVYLASTNSGNVYRFADNGDGVSNLEVFVAAGNYTINGVSVAFSWPDNLAFDGEGNLWVLQDGGDNHIWVVGPSHTTAAPDLRVFGNTPTEAFEPTGITFSPDYKYLFMSIQHPSGSNTQPQADAAGTDVAFDNNTVLVIARKENLGNGAILPLRFVDLQLQAAGAGVKVLWKVSEGTQNLNFSVERSADGSNFVQVGQVHGTPGSQGYMAFADEAINIPGLVYYRIKACDASGSCLYSMVKSMKNTTGVGYLSAMLQASNRVALRIGVNMPGPVSIKLITTDGRQVLSAQRKDIVAGQQVFLNLPAGLKGYCTAVVYTGGTSYTASFLIP